MSLIGCKAVSNISCVTLNAKADGKYIASGVSSDLLSHAKKVQKNKNGCSYEE